MPDPLLLTPRRAAEVAGIGRDSLYELVRTGEIKSIRVGRRWLVPVWAIERWIKETAQ
jgi:excisionase family DNA binding protein